MGFIKTIKNAILPNSMESNIHIVGEEPVTMSNSNEESVNWKDMLPNLVEPTIINLRTCYSKVDLVNGVIKDLAIKSISGWEIEADTDEIKEYLTEEFKRLNLTSLMFSNVINNLVDGAVYYNVVIEDGKLSLRELAFDGENYRIMEVKDPITREVIGYKQVVKINKNTNQGWMNKKFRDLAVESLEEVEFNFTADEVISTHFLTMYGVHQGIVETVLDTAYEYLLLRRMMNQIVYKQSNTMIIQKDMERTSTNENLMGRIKSVLKNLSNFHTKGVIHVPSDFTVSMIGNSNLPELQNYLKVFENDIYKGLITPPAVFESSSSNRSTAVVQLDSKSSGRVLFQKYIQMEEADFVQEIIEQLLLLGHFPEGSARIVFRADEDENDKENHNISDDEYDITNENGNISTSKPGDGLNLKNIHNGEGRLAETSS